MLEGSFKVVISRSCGELAVDALRRIEGDFSNLNFKVLEGAESFDDLLSCIERGEVDAVLCDDTAVGADLDPCWDWFSLSVAHGMIRLIYPASSEGLGRLRRFYTYSCCFMGSGPGDESLCTVEGIKALQNCDICLHDALIAPRLLEHLPASARAIDVGKRADGAHTPQEEINRLLVEHLRRGYRVVRLKGGDPGIFARLPEEVASLEEAGFAYWVIPGISSFNAATTGTGMLLTRRGVSRGFSIITPRLAGGDTASIGADVRATSSLVFFMAVKKIAKVCAQLLSEGHAADESVAVVFAAGTRREKIVHSTIANVAADIAGYDRALPGLFMVGRFTASQFLYGTQNGALAGRQVILTCADESMDSFKAAVRARGGVPRSYPLLQHKLNDAARSRMTEVLGYDWLLFTSALAVRQFRELLCAQEIDLRSLPRICADGEAAVALAEWGIRSDVAEIAAASGTMLHCSASGDSVGMARGSLQLDELALGECVALEYDHQPQGQMILFTHVAAVCGYIDQFGVEGLASMMVIACGATVAAALRAVGAEPDSTLSAVDPERAIALVAAQLV